MFVSLYCLQACNRDTSGYRSCSGDNPNPPASIFKLEYVLRNEEGTEHETK